MASSSSSSLLASATSSSQSCNYDVFLSFRGEDTRKTFVDHLYSALVDRNISTYKDDETLPRGESIRPSLFSAIEGSQIAVVILSENYADSSWCLDELSHIMKCNGEKGLIVMPVFYDVVPSEVRKQNRTFAEAFARHEIENIEKIESWRKALVDASDISGWEVKTTANGHEAKVIKQIVDTISNKLFSVYSFVVDEDLVGMSTRMQQLEEQLDIGSGGVRMVGVWGLGGGGKTTLASSLYMKVKDSHYFQGHCIIENIRLESSKQGLKSLQENLLSTLLKTKVKLDSILEGKRMIRSRLENSKVLILVDDVDDLSQLDALVGSHNWFGNGSRIIITTRDEHLLRTHKVDLVCPVTLLSYNEAIMLFNKRAYNKDNPVNDYETLSLHVVSYAAGLPLALIVLGSFLYDKNEKEWLSCLSRLKEIPEIGIVEKLKISYDGLKTVEKELFLDIACFFRGESTEHSNILVSLKLIFFEDDPLEVLEACGYHLDIGVKVLRQKALLTFVNGRFAMHDLVQELGHYIVRGEHSYNPEKHSRVWKYEDIMRLGDATKENHEIEAIQYFLYEPSLSSLYFCKIVSNMKKLRYLSVSLSYNSDKNLEGPDFLSNGLRYIRWNSYPRSPFPDNFQPMKLVTLRLHGSLQKQLWRDDKHLPHLKVIVLEGMTNLLSTPNFDGFPSLQKLALHYCEELEDIHPSLGRHTSLEYVTVSCCRKLRMFPTIINMGNLKSLRIEYCHESLEFPVIKSKMESLAKLYLHNMGIDALLPSVGDQCPNLISLEFDKCSYSNNVEVNFYGLKHLEEFKCVERNRSNMTPRTLIGKVVYGRDRDISQYTHYRLWLLGCRQLTHSIRKLNLSDLHVEDGKIPSNICELSNLQELDLRRNSLTRLDFSLSQLTRLKVLNVSRCYSLVELPKLPSGIVVLDANHCDSLTTLGDVYTDCKWLSKVSLVGGGVINDGNILLQSMIEGNALQNHSMILAVDGLEIAEWFERRLVRGQKRFRLELPDNWSNDFSGFLFCVVGMKSIIFWSFLIKMEALLSGVDSEDYVAEWKERRDDKQTVVWYVPFASLRNTSWWKWNSRHKELFFTLKPKLVFSSIDHEAYYMAEVVSGFGVKLVAGRKSESGPLETSTTQEEESEISNYAPKLRIEEDSIFALRVELPSTEYKENSWL